MTIEYSAIIPVYNSEPLVLQTIARTAAFFEVREYSYEIIAVNDGSHDGSWQKLDEAAEGNPNVVAINLLRNYGQHTAILCGLQQSQGEYVVTLDDDLQNPPEEIEHLISAADAGHDLVFGQFQTKQHTLSRRLGSRIVWYLNRWIFSCPPDLVVSNFRLVRRDVVNRMIAHRTTHPYITGLALLYAAHPVNASVAHHPRPIGRSSYNIGSLLKLVMRILFNYSAFPLRIVSVIGGMVAFGGFLLALYYLVQYFRGHINIPGWISLFVSLTILNGISILMVGMVGEYMVRLLREMGVSQPYQIQKRIDNR